MKSILKAKTKANILLRAMLLSAAMVYLLPNGGWSMLAPAQNALAADGTGFDRATDIKSVQTALEFKIVRDRLAAFGLNDKQIESRLRRLSDRQLHKFAKDVKALNPGGGLVYVLEVVVLVLLILILV
ncbi:MAG: hypothetical protein A2X34_05305 [Elusimicrobia bacterium GWC2_51_8]|nr:MAG: hypothetical protein A2X33_09975 [Elusimicrobia bacterium GWA2_51_34]OGR58033.1 MAG: hypothetical protein A2X34_05305 [Elusimicrobia bacterium GWC2_51_8]